MSTFGDRVKERRYALGYTQDELAQKMGYSSRSSINKIEASERSIPQRKLIKLAEVLETTPTYLMGLSDDPEPQAIKVVKRDGTTSTYDKEKIAEMMWIGKSREDYIKLLAEQMVKIHMMDDEQKVTYAKLLLFFSDAPEEYRQTALSILEQGASKKE